jgi:hypothetical protein
MALRRIRPGLLAIAMLLFSLALAIACGGQEEPQPGESPTPEGGALSSCEALEELKAYRYTVYLLVESPEPPENATPPPPTPGTTIIRNILHPVLFDYTIEASYVAPDRLDAMTIQWLPVSGEERELPIVIIGDRRWFMLADQWVEDPRVPLSYRPLDICSAIFPDLDLSQAEPRSESVNGVKTLYYSLADVFSEQGMARIFGPGSEMDILLKRLNVDLWLAEDGGWPARMEIRSSGFFGDGREFRVELTVDLRDVNSEEIKVEPPI